MEEGAEQEAIVEEEPVRVPAVEVAAPFRP